jgi:hypothetical protein
VASQQHTATVHGTDMMLYGTPDGSTANTRFLFYDATNNHVEIEKKLLLDAAGADLEITSTQDAKIILRDDGTAAWNRIDFYETTNRHGYLGFDTANEFLFVNEESAGPIRLQTTGGGAITVSDDGGTTENRIASIAAIVDTGTPSGTPTYGAMYMVY